MTDLDAVLRQRLKWIFSQRGWTVTAAARELGIPQNTLYQFITGRTTIRLSTFSKVCDGLAIPAQELLADGKSSPAYEALQVSMLRSKLRAIRELASEP